MARFDANGHLMCGWGGAKGDPAPCPERAGGEYEHPDGYTVRPRWLCARHAAIIGTATRRPRAAFVRGRPPAPVTVRQDDSIRRKRICAHPPCSNELAPDAHRFAKYCPEHAQPWQRKPPKPPKVCKQDGCDVVLEDRRRHYCDMHRDRQPAAQEAPRPPKVCAWPTCEVELANRQRKFCRRHVAAKLRADSAERYRLCKADPECYRRMLERDRANRAKRAQRAAA
jgi:hypothetical protein